MRFTVLYNSTFWGLINITFGAGLGVGAYQLETVTRWQAYEPWTSFGAGVLALFAVFFVFRGVADVLS